MRDFDRTVLSQYSNSTILCQLLQGINDCLDPQADLEAFYDLIWNIDTAVGYGLDVWGRIVGIQRVLTVVSEKFFGFDEQGAANVDAFNQGPFYSGTVLTSNVTLTDEAFRLLIFAKAAANITDGSIPSINAILRGLFPQRGNCYVAEGPFLGRGLYFGFTESGTAVGWNQGIFADLSPSAPSGMSLTYVFEFGLEPFEVSIVTSSGVLPKPTGVLAKYSYLTVT